MQFIFFEGDFFTALFFNLLLFLCVLSWLIIARKMIQIALFKTHLIKNQQLLHEASKQDLGYWHNTVSRLNPKNFLYRVYHNISALAFNSYSSDSWEDCSQQYVLQSLKEEQKKYLKGLGLLIGIAKTSFYLGILGSVLALIVKIYPAVICESISYQSLKNALYSAVECRIYALLVAIPAYLAYNKFLTRCAQQMRMLKCQCDYLIQHIYGKKIVFPCSDQLC